MRFDDLGPLPDGPFDNTQAARALVRYVHRFADVDDLPLARRHAYLTLLAGMMGGLIWTLSREVDGLAGDAGAADAPHTPASAI